MKATNRRSTIESISPRKSDPIRRQSLSAAVVERLREKILTGELREGEQLRQDAIATEFQISRIPVREALSHLAAEGLITIVANRGAIVSALSPDEIMQMFETRAVLECYMLRHAIPNMKQADFQRAEDILVQYEQSLKKDSEVKPVEFDIPAEATAGGTLTLEWQANPEESGNGRFVQIAEVWLIRK